MIEVYVEEVDGCWFGLAHNRERIIATTIGSDKKQTLKSLINSLPSNAEHEIVERASGFVENAISKLKKAHTSEEDFGAFELETKYVSEPHASVLRVAASIPIGYVASYGSIAKAAGADARLVGQIMASNPIYPIVACHRVVGADFSLVGYGGRKSPSALRAKLIRLTAERRGFKSPREVSTGGLKLTVHPVESVIKKAENKHPRLCLETQRRLSGYR